MKHSKRHILLQRIHNVRRLRRHRPTLLTVTPLLLVLSSRGDIPETVFPELPSMEGEELCAVIERTWRPTSQVIVRDLSRVYDMLEEALPIP